MISPSTGAAAMLDIDEVRVCTSISSLVLSLSWDFSSPFLLYEIPPSITESSICLTSISFSKTRVLRRATIFMPFFPSAIFLSTLDLVLGQISPYNSVCRSRIAACRRPLL